MEEELLLSPAEVVVLPLTSFTSAEEMNHCCIPTAYAHTCIVLGLLWSSRATQWCLLLSEHQVSHSVATAGSAP